MVVVFRGLAFLACFGTSVGLVGNFCVYQNNDETELKTENKTKMDKINTHI